VCVDDRVRLTASLLLLTKFVRENSGSKVHPLRVETLEYLRGKESHPCVTVCRELAEQHWMSVFYCYAVVLRQEALVFSSPEPGEAEEGADHYIVSFRQACLAGIQRYVRVAPS